MSELLGVDVWRGAEQGAFQAFAIPRRTHQTVLDVVTEIQREHDATLSYRFACRVGMCGSCAMVVNGRPRWTCRTRVNEVVKGGERLRLEPLRNFTVVKDLAVEMTDFFDKWKKAHGFFEPGAAPDKDFAVVPPTSPERVNCDAGIECIGCGVCYAACDVVAWEPGYSATGAGWRFGSWSAWKWSPLRWAFRAPGWRPASRRRSNARANGAGKWCIC